MCWIFVPFSVRDWYNFISSSVGFLEGIISLIPIEIPGGATSYARFLISLGEYLPTASVVTCRCMLGTLNCKSFKAFKHISELSIWSPFSSLRWKCIPSAPSSKHNFAVSTTSSMVTGTSIWSFFLGLAPLGAIIILGKFSGW